MSKSTSLVDSTMEIHHYFQAGMLARKEDPASWWEFREEQFPALSKLAEKYLCIPSTSVASERVFSKAGDLISAKRSRLKPKHVDMYLFLNKNM